MLLILKGELIKKGNDPVKAIMEAIQRSEETAWNKLNGRSPFSIPQALSIKKTFFEEDDFDIEWLFYDSKQTG